METSNSYCNFAYNQKEDTIHKLYHDTQYGFPIHSDNELFGRLILEINQAGLSWDIILKKQENFRIAYSNFDIKSVANYNQTDINRLLNNAGIIRNKLKVRATISNAVAFLQIALVNSMDQRAKGAIENVEKLLIVTCASSTQIFITIFVTFFTKKHNI